METIYSTDKIEKVYQLLTGTDFQRFVELVKTQDLKFWFGDRVNPTDLDFTQIEATRKEFIEGHKRMYQFNISQAPNPKYLLYQELIRICDTILGRNLQALTSVLKGETPFLNLSLIGELWGRSEVFFEWRNIFNSLNSGLQISKQTGFKTTLHPDKLKPLFTRLIEKGYIAPGTDFNNFAACFNGLPLPDTFAPVQWIKRNKKNKLPAKKTLMDLLTLMGTPKEQTRDNSKLKTFFVDYTGNPLIFTGSNFDNNNDNNDHSEYFPELQNIINSL